MSTKTLRTLYFVTIFTLALLLPACARQPQSARIEEITFQSGEFTLVGELSTPAATGLLPLVIFVHGNGARAPSFV